MATRPRRLMTADELLRRTREQPEGRRHELSRGKLVAVAAERAAHHRAGGGVLVVLRRASRAKGLPCRTARHPQARHRLDARRLPSLHRYPVVDTSQRLVVHHRRGADGGIEGRVVREGTFLPDPPGNELEVADLVAGG